MKLYQLDELSPFEKLGLIDFSYSRLDTYLTCPAKYFYTYILREERQFGPAAALGNVIHCVLEDVVGGALDLIHMRELMQQYREQYDPEKKIPDDLLETGSIILAEFVDNHADDTFDVIGKELPFSLVLGSALVVGYIDLVTKEPGRIRITDWKTGKWEVSANKIPSNLQLGIYALAASHYYPQQTIHAELYYLRSGHRKGHTFTPEDLEGVYEQVLAQVQEIINDRFFQPTQDTRPCSYCDHAVSGVCSTGAARVRRWRR